MSKHLLEIVDQYRKTCGEKTPEEVAALKQQMRAVLFEMSVVFELDSKTDMDKLQHSNDVLRVIARVRGRRISELQQELAAVKLTCEALENQLGQWKANHSDVVARNRILRDRPDLPADRIPAVEQLEVLQQENHSLRLQCVGMQLVMDELRAGAAPSTTEDRRPE